MLIGLGTGMRIIGSRYSPDVRRLRDFAARNRLPHRWIDLESDPGTESLVQQLGVAPEDTPLRDLVRQAAAPQSEQRRTGGRDRAAYSAYRRRQAAT